MARKMLIDATHEEETRVAIVEGERLEEYDYESAFRKALKGNIYLAKVTRVEPSLQAAFVNFGGNRHGFLPFSEIHPDYFRIPVADREALMAAQEEELKEHDAAEAEEDAKEGSKEPKDDSQGIEDKITTIEPDEKPKAKSRSRRKKKDEDQPAEEGKSEEKAEKEEEKKTKPKSRSRRKKAEPETEDFSAIKQETGKNDADGNIRAPDPVEEDDIDGNNEKTDNDSASSKRNNRGSKNRGGRNRGGRGRNMQNRNREAEIVDKESNDQSDEKRFRYNLRRKYKIQEVIKRGQIMLIQVSKEERGNKGAAVGSYLSLPGRYCVLMPNSPRSGGVSRKIANYKDRAKMRDMLKEIDVPKGMSVIMRTAGVTRTKTEIKRDLDYLLRLWDKIRELTMESTAPALVYEEADLIKRAVRDLYTRDVEEIIVSGEKGHKNAKDFMKMMIPSHVKRITEYKDPIPLFSKYKVEDQINEMSQPTATMKSGGYLVINPTEALVSIDVNSGKATKERHIEGTALKTNLEAADEVARQLRLRDLGGLVVIDFIDMERSGNNGKVERRLRDALAGDRARIQIGRISSFGLLELSRQRMNPSITEAQFEICPHCEGIGNIRTPDATSVLVIRAIEDEGIKGRAAQLIVHVTTKVALYILNGKRMHLSDLEDRYKLDIMIRIDDTLAASDFRIEVAKPSEKGEQDNSERNNNRNRSRNTTNDEDGKEGTNPRRRGRRGGRNRNRNRDENQDNADSNQNEASENKQEANQAENLSGKDTKDEKPRRGRRPAAKKTEEGKEEAKESSLKSEDAPKKEPKKRTSRAKKPTEENKTEDTPKEAKKEKAATKEQAAPSNDEKPTEPSHASNFETVNETPKKKKKGWWSKG